MGDADLDYLQADWFRDMIKSDSAKWSEPFNDGYFANEPLTAYMVTIHDQEGRVVAVLGADISFDWLTSKLSETDSIINKKSMFMASKFKMKSNSFLIDNDGTFLTHPDKNSRRKDNLYSQIEPCNGSDVTELIARMQAGMETEGGSSGRFLVNGEECYLLYTPVKYTTWLLVTVVPCHAIDMLGYLNAGTLSFIILLAMLLLVVAGHYFIRSAIEPLSQLTLLTDDIANGHFDNPVPDLKYNDEISQLRDSIEKMQFKLSNKASSDHT